LLSIIENTKSYQLDLAKTLAAIKDDDAIFYDAFPSLLDSLPMSTTTINVLVYVYVVMPAFSAFCIVILLYRPRSFADTVVLGQAMPTTEGFHLNIAHTTLPTPQTTLATHMIQIPLTLFP